MADNVNDKEVLKKEYEERRKEIEEIADYIKKEMGFNISSNKFGVKETHDGRLALVIRGEFDKTKLPKEWNYESNYLLDGDYGKEGIWRWKDGKREFIPIEHEPDKSEEVVYSSPEDVVDAILSVNNHIDKSQIYCDEHSGAIIIVGVVNNIEMPQGLKMEDGFIVDINDYGKKYEVYKSTANDISPEASTPGSGDIPNNLSQQPYYDNPSLSSYVKTDDEGAEFHDFGKSVFDFYELRDVYNNFAKNTRGEVVSSGNNGNYQVMNNMQEKNPMVEARLELANIWVNAYELASGQQGNGDAAFVGDQTNLKFNQMIEMARDCQGKKTSEVVKYLFDRGMEAKIAVYFLTDPRIARYFDFKQDLTQAMAIEKLEELKRKRSQDLANGLIGPMLNTSSENGFEIGDDNDDSPVMTKTK